MLGNRNVVISINTVTQQNNTGVLPTRMANRNMTPNG